ncbi:hypothetical protein M569_14516, partial [Genlisea aurea]
SGVSEEEENWRAQYGQVSHQSTTEDRTLHLQAVDLWDWSLVKELRKDGKKEVSRLIGMLTKRTAKLHPSVSSARRIFKTAPVCETHLDVVRVTSGRVYRLRIPSLQYLSSSPSYDPSNPTKDWGFPELSIRDDEPRNTEESSFLLDRIVTSGWIVSRVIQGHRYRDRAAERRSLHGGFGIGPGQKHDAASSVVDSVPSSPEAAAAESLSVSFGAGSYARNLLEGMGWKE